MSLAAVVQVAQILAPIVAAVAAVASWRSATASLRTARRSDTTSKRAVEALSRAARPRLDVRLYAQEDATGAEAVPAVVDVVNGAPNRGLISAVRLARSDGLRTMTSRSLPVVLGADTVPYEEDHAQTFPVGRIVPSMPGGAGAAPNAAGFPTPDDPGADVVITVTIDFADAPTLVTWRQDFRFREQVQRVEVERLAAGTREMEPRWLFSLIDVSDPVVVTDLGRL